MVHHNSNGTTAGAKFKAGEHFKTFMENMRLPYDHQAVMDSHRKNVETLTQASKMAVEVIQSVAKLQAQFLKQTFEDIGKMVRESNPQAMSKEHLEKCTQSFKQHMERTRDHGNQVAEIVTRSAREIHNKLHSRTSEGLEELKAMHTKKKTKPK